MNTVKSNGPFTIHGASQRDFLSVSAANELAPDRFAGLLDLPIENTEHLIKVATKWHKCLSLLS